MADTPGLMHLEGKQWQLAQLPELAELVEAGTERRFRVRLPEGVPAAESLTAAVPAMYAGEWSIADGVLDISERAWCLYQDIAYTLFMVPSARNVARTHGFKRLPQTPYLMRLLFQTPRNVSVTHRQHQLYCFARVVASWVAAVMAERSAPETGGFSRHDIYTLPLDFERISVYALLPRVLCAMWKACARHNGDYVALFESSRAGLDIVFTFFHARLELTVHRFFFAECRALYDVCDHEYRTAHEDFFAHARKMEAALPAGAMQCHVDYIEYESESVADFRMLFYALIADEATDPDVALALLCHAGTRLTKEQTWRERFRIATTRDTPRRRRDLEIVRADYQRATSARVEDLRVEAPLVRSASVLELSEIYDFAPKHRPFIKMPAVPAAEVPPSSPVVLAPASDEPIIALLAFLHRLDWRCGNMPDPAFPDYVSAPMFDPTKSVAIHCTPTEILYSFRSFFYFA